MTASPSDLIGVLNVNKAAGWTAHDVVARVRRLSGQRRVGHAGTLDPLAEGVLPVLLGPATRLMELAQAGRKRYTADIQLGSATTTDDAEGEVVYESPVPPLDRAVIEATLRQFEGEIDQLPPRFSAIKVGGRRAYAVARRGGELVLSPRRVVVHRLTLIDLEPDRLVLDVECGRGTYVRSLARDLAEALGTRGHLRHLVRTQVGDLRLADALTLDEIADTGVARALLPPDVLLAGTPAYDADPLTLTALLHGRPVPAAGMCSPHVQVRDTGGRLRLIASADGTLLRPRIALVRDQT
jgi:tRNA pseudouridine55 synthase